MAIRERDLEKIGGIRIGDRIWFTEAQNYCPAGCNPEYIPVAVFFDTGRRQWIVQGGFEETPENFKNAEKIVEFVLAGIISHAKTLSPSRDKRTQQR